MVMEENIDTLFRLSKAQVKHAGHVLARAFQDDPLFCYYIPDASKRRVFSHYLWEFLVRYGILYGEVYAISMKLEGVAIWLYSEYSAMTCLKVIRGGGWKLPFLFGREFVSRAIHAQIYLSSVHKRHAPLHHVQLFIIGIDPCFQGRGLASALINPMLERLDQKQLPCYLGTQNPRNIQIYEGYGFRVVEESKIPDTNVSHYAMLRENLLKPITRRQYHENCTSFKSRISSQVSSRNKWMD